FSSPAHGALGAPASGASSGRRRALAARAAPVTDEHVGHAVGVPGHEVVGVRGEGHEAAVGAERGAAAVTVPLGRGAAHAPPLGEWGVPVVDEHVTDFVAVPGREVGGGRGEGDEAPVGAERDPMVVRADEAGGVPLDPGTVYAHSLGESGLTVMD